MNTDFVSMVTIYIFAMILVSIAFAVLAADALRQMGQIAENQKVIKKRIELESAMIVRTLIALKGIDDWDKDKIEDFRRRFEEYCEKGGWRYAKTD